MAGMLKVAETVSSVLTAADRVKSALYDVKVSRVDANELERQLEGELFEKWNESFECMHCTKVPMTNLGSFLNRLENSYEGINKNIRKKMESIFDTGTWEEKLIEWKFNVKGDSGARYGMMAFGKSADGKEVDFMYILYKMDFQMAPKETVVTKEKSLLFGLVGWTTDEKQSEPKYLGLKTKNRFENFFRMKALEGFRKEGVIDRVNYEK